MLARATTVGMARRAAGAALRDAGIEQASLDARLLVGHVTGLSHAEMASQPDRSVSAAQASAIAAAVKRRLAGEPVARIRGCKEFWGLPLALSRETLVPRPETETIVEAALAAVRPRRNAPMRVADLGTGSGALLLALLSELPRARGTGTDVSEDAIRTARGNARQLGLADRAEFILCDYGSALAGGFDLVVSNPPYIASTEIAGLPAEVRAHDPVRALDGGADGLEAFRAIAADAGRLLAPHGLLVVELGAGQVEPVIRVLAAHGLRHAAIRDDLAGIPRALTATSAA